MNLHRTNHVPEWELTSEKEWNFWQKIAAKTNSLVTPGNIFSVTGIVLVSVGLFQLQQQSLISGFSFVLVGRLADILDGWAAHKSKTKSPFGEILDATLDKVAMILALIVFAITGLVPLYAVVIAGFFNAGNAISSIVARIRKQQIHPSRSGKLSGAAIWISLLLYVLHGVMQKYLFLQFTNEIFVIASVLFIGAIILSIVALVGYVGDAAKSAEN